MKTSKFSSLKVNALIFKSKRLFPRTRGNWSFLRGVRAELVSKKISLKLFTQPNRKLTDCDLLVVSSRAYTSAIRSERATGPALLERWSSRTNLAWFDERDSAGNVDTMPFPYVDAYWKQQAYRDRNKYKKPLYQGRLYADFYHHELGITDPSPEPANCLSDNELSKIKVAWNLGLKPTAIQGSLRAHNIGKVFWQTAYPRSKQFFGEFTSPSSERQTPVTALFNTRYPPTIRWQRERILEILRATAPAGSIVGVKIPRRKYLEALRDSKIVVSAFGWGEVCLREYEAIVAGAAVVMPDMSHIETWPNPYQGGQTYFPVAWTLEDLPTVLETVLRDNDLRLEVAKRGQRVLNALVFPAGRELFAERFKTLVHETIAR